MEKKLQRFLRYLEAERGCSLRTIKAYTFDLARGLGAFLHRRGKLDVSQVTTDDIRAFLDFLTFERGNSSAARARKLAAVKSFFRYLVENEGLQASPAAAIRGPRVPNREPDYLTEEECIRLLQTVSQKAKPQVRERDMAMLVLLLHTGIRVSELVNLKPANVDLKAGQMKVVRKGNREQYMPLNRETLRVLARYAATRPAGRDGQFFAGVGGRRLSRRSPPPQPSAEMFYFNPPKACVTPFSPRAVQYARLCRVSSVMRCHLDYAFRNIRLVSLVVQDILHGPCATNLPVQDNGYTCGQREPPDAFQRLFRPLPPAPQASCST